MRSLSELPATPLEWRRNRSAPSEFLLQAGDGAHGDVTIASLAFLDDECTLARVETAEGIWTLKHLGLLAPVITLRAEGSQKNLATFHPHALRHGKLRFDDGPVFEWVWLHGTAPSGAFLDAEGLPLVRLSAHPGRDLQSISGLERCEVSLGLAPSPRSRQALLAAVGWYLLLFDTLKEREVVAAETALRL
jgi:hypothetical protein